MSKNDEIQKRKYRYYTSSAIYHVSFIHSVTRHTWGQRRLHPQFGLYKTILSYYAELLDCVLNDHFSISFSFVSSYTTLYMLWIKWIKKKIFRMFYRAYVGRLAATTFVLDEGVKYVVPSHFPFNTRFGNLCIFGRSPIFDRIYNSSPICRYNVHSYCI